MNTFDEEIAQWVGKHPYLKNIADFQSALDIAYKELLKEEGRQDQIIYDWEFAKRELKRGIPVLRAEVMTDDMKEQIAKFFIKTSDLMLEFEFSDEMRRKCQKIQTFFLSNRDILNEYIEEILRGDEFTVAEFVSIHRGIFIFMLWNSLYLTLEPLKILVGHSLPEIGWERSYCPLCGQLPSMAQTTRKDNGEERILVCSCCKMRWTYGASGCPFCQSANSQQTSIISLPDENEFCIEACDKCQGYLKIYTKFGMERIALNDWSTLHVDMIAKNNGLKRIGYQLYEV